MTRIQRGLVFAIIALAVAGTLVGTAAATGAFYAETRYGTRFIPQSALSNLKNCTSGNQCAYVDTTATPNSHYYDGTNDNINAAIPATTKGDLAVFNGTNWARLGVGSNTQVLTADSTQATGVKWAAGGGGGGGMAIGAAVTSGTAKSVLFVDGSSDLAQDNTSLNYDSSAKLLTVKTTATDGSAANLTLDSTSGGSGLGSGVVRFAQDGTANTVLLDWPHSSVSYLVKGFNIAVATAEQLGLSVNSTQVLVAGTAGIGSDSSHMNALPAVNGSTLAALGLAQTWTKSQNVAAVALTDGASIATDASLGNSFTVTLGGNRTLSNPTNLVSGGTYLWTVTQDGTGSRTLAYDTDFKWPGGVAPTLSTAAGAVDVITCSYTGSTLKCVGQLNFQ